MAVNLTLASDSGAVSMVEVSPTAKVSTLALLVQAELSIPPAEQDLRFNGEPLQPSRTISQSGITDGDLIMVSRKQPAPPAPPAAAAASEPSSDVLSTQDAGTLDAILGNDQIMSALRRTSPQLHAALRARDPRAYRALQGVLANGGLGALANRAITGRGPPGQRPPQTFDPMSADAQKQIEERIRMENVMKNMEAAIEHNPESFGSVIMLFVDCKVNSVAGVKAFVDRYVSISLFHSRRGQTPGSAP